MELSATETVAVPINLVWAEVTNFDQFEAGLRKRDVALERSGEGSPAVGTAWTAEFPLAGRRLKADARIARIESPRVLRFEGSGTGIDGYGEVTLTAVDGATTRLDLVVGLKAKAIGAQVVLQPLRLAQGKLKGQLDAQLGRIARSMEGRYVEANGGEEY